MSSSRFAVLGAKPLFERPLPVGQLYFPSWERYTRALGEIFQRQYYTNHGPLARKLEEELSRFFAVNHVICVTNATIGLLMAADALELRGKVILPAFSFIASAHSLSWAGLRPVFCEVDRRTHQIDVDDAARLIDGETSAIMAVNLWGGACDVPALEALAAKAGIALYFDSAHAVGCRIGDVPVGRFGRLEVFSFHATKVLSAAEGGCICTNDDELAARLRNIRSSYGAGPPVEVSRTANGRMSEAQAAVALMSLEDFEANRANNEALYARYRAGLKAVPGLRLVEPSAVSQTNSQYVVCEVDAARFGLARDELMSVLRAENVLARRYFHPGIHRSLPYNRDPQARALPATDALCASCIQLPIGALVSPAAVDTICELVGRAREHAASLQPALAGAASRQ